MSTIVLRLIARSEESQSFLSSGREPLQAEQELGVGRGRVRAGVGGAAAAGQQTRDRHHSDRRRHLLQEVPPPQGRRLLRQVHRGVKVVYIGYVN